MGLKYRTILIFTGLIIIIFVAVMLTVKDDSLRRIQQDGVIRIGYAVEAPYVLLEPGGKVTGAEAEIAKVVVNRLGLQSIQWRLYEFDQLIPALETGQIDAIVAGMFITPQRAERVSFSEPTFHVQQGLLVKTGNPHQINSYAEIASMPDIKIAVITGSIEEVALQHLGVNSAQLISVPDALTGRVAVESGAVDGLALSELSIRWMDRQDQLGRTEMAQPFEQDKFLQDQFLGYGAVVFRQEDNQLRTNWNKALKEYLGTPAHLSLIAPFGFSAAESPGAVTIDEILSLP